MSKRHLGQLLSPISKHLTGVRTAARVVSRTKGLRLLLDSSLRSGTQLTPDVYPFAAYLARGHGCQRVVAVGGPAAKDLLPLCQQFDIEGLVHAAALDSYRRRYGFANWMEADFETGRLSLSDEEILSSAVVVCAGVLEGLADPAPLLRSLKQRLEVAPACVLTDSGRSPEELERLLGDEGLAPAFVGLTACDDLTYEKSVAIAVFTNRALAAPRGMKAPPWPGLSYRDGLYLVDRLGFNLVDHTVINFKPVDDGFRQGMDHEAYFRHFEFGTLPSYFRQQKAWKNCGRPIQMAASGGHDLPFEGQRVYPFKFLLKHYPVRSQQHGERKVFRERKARWNPLERARGWHRHYDSVRAGHRFVEEKSGQLRFGEAEFNRTFLVERLSGVGVIR